MTLKTVLRTCGASALAVAVAIGAFTAPASAQDRRERGSERSEARQSWREQRTERAQEQAQPRQQRAEAPQQQRQQRSYDAGRAQQAQAAPQRPSGDWNRGDRRSATGTERMGRDWNRRDNSSNDWGQQRAAQAQPRSRAARCCSARRRTESTAL